ncbi:MAG: type VI secretion system baseplate subunit TssF [Paracoccus sp. (in: a-proteobacteria)]|nr:type VI secretion system baseplate subunit TssF [Paracoccus sp. (in: a-proteobacteria)]
MKKAFRDAYNRELALLYERSAEFAQDYPGLADRLGGLLRENADPAVAGLLEGTAFLAARVQLRMDEEFRAFTTELLEQIFPEALAPIPAVILARANLPEAAGPLEAGIRFAPGAIMDARFVDAEQRVSCRFTTASELVLWPLEIGEVSYFDRTGPLGALGQDPDQAARAGLSIEIARTDAGVARHGGIGGLPIRDLPIHFLAESDQAIALYEQIFCDRLRVSLRWLTPQGDAVFRRLSPDQIAQIGFDGEARLFPRDTRLFDGFAELREAAIFPRKYLGFRIIGLERAFQGINADRVQLVFEFARPDDMLAVRLGRDHFGLFCTPAVNLFEETASQVRLDGKREEYIVTPDSTPLTHYEIHRLTEVHAHYAGGTEKVEVRPLYALPDGDVPARQALYYTSRRRDRRLTVHERRFGMRQRYRGTETLISIYEPPSEERSARAQRLQIKALCSNRHLPELLPLAGSRGDFFFADDTTVTLDCVAGPTLPREAMTDLDKRGPHRLESGNIHWRLISYLALNHFGLDDRGGRDAAASLRELLSLFADLSDAVTETQIAGIQHVETRPVTRSIRRAEGYFPARGLEIAITYNETAFEGSGMILLAAVLDRYLAEYASINSFTQTVAISAQRGEIKRWPPRTGTGPLI